MSARASGRKASVSKRSPPPSPSYAERLAVIEITLEGLADQVAAKIAATMASKRDLEALVERVVDLEKGAAAAVAAGKASIDVFDRLAPLIRDLLPWGVIGLVMLKGAGA